MRNVALFIAIFITLTSTPLKAADSKGSFAVRNAGMTTCQRFVDEKKKNSPVFNLYMGWIDGYISAANQYTADTYDLIPWGNTAFLATLLQNHCSKHPDQRFYVAVNQLAAAMLDQRLVTRSEMIETSNKGKKTHIYKSILLKVQLHLRELKMYTGKADGEYGPGTRSALEMFQKESGLAVTGLPDQLTLYKVFQKLNAK